MFQKLAVFLVACFVATLLAANATAAIDYAVVDQFGTLVNGSPGAVSATQIGTGQYEVTFNTAVNGCAFVATTENAYTQAIQAYTAGGHLSSTNGVYVETKNQGGGLTNGPFDLEVICTDFATEFAVVGYSANLVRSTPGTTLTALGPGQYDVNFPSSVAGCAYVATVGDPGNALVFNPSGVYTGSGPASNSVYIETKNPGGGLQPEVPFHLGVVCPPQPGARVLVVAADGLAKQGSPLTSSFNSSTGEYSVVTNMDVSACAAIATRGSVDTSVPFAPTTVEIIRDVIPNVVDVEERSLLFFGGGLANEAFHVVIARSGT